MLPKEFFSVVCTNNCRQKRPSSGRRACAGQSCDISDILIMCVFGGGESDSIQKKSHDLRVVNAVPWQGELDELSAFWTDCLPHDGGGEGDSCREVETI